MELHDWLQDEERVQEWMKLHEFEVSVAKNQATAK